MKRDHLSLATPEGILLMGGYDKKSVDLLKPDGTIQRGVFNLERLIEYTIFHAFSNLMIFIFSRGCGIEDEGTLIITGGGSNGRSDSVATKIVDRYNSKVAFAAYSKDNLMSALNRDL